MTIKLPTISKNYIKKLLDYTLKELKKDKNVLAIIQFGSSLNKKELSPLSDIDIAVILFDPEKNNIIESYSVPPILEVLDFYRLPPFIKYEIIKKHKILFCRNKKQLNKIFKEAIIEYKAHIPYYERIGLIKEDQNEE